jgi:AsmA protein
MKLSLKTVGLVLGGLIGVVIVSLALFFVFFPKDLAAREAERRIEEATGRELTLGNDIEISFYPALGFSVDQASLSNPEGFSADEPFIAAERIVFAVKVLPLLRGAIEVKQLIFQGAAINLQAKQDGAANWTFPTDQSAPEQQTTIEDLRLDDVRLIDSAITFRGADGGAPTQLEDVDASLALESLDAPARLNAAFNYRDERVTLESEIGAPRAVLEKGQTPFSADIQADPIDATFAGAFDAATGALTGRLEADGASVRQLAAWMGSPMGEGGGFGRFRVTGDMTHQGETTALTNAALRLDEIDARGALSLITQESGSLRVTGALQTASVDLNDYLPAPAQGGEAGVEVDTAWPQTPLDLSGLRALDANIDLTLGALQFQRMSFTDVALNLRIANGAADARLSRIALYGGAGTARLIADGASRTPRIAVELNAENIQAEPLLRDAIGFDKIVGRGRVSASFVGQGGTQAALMRALDGSAAFTFSDGQWKGVNLAQVARTVQAAITGQTGGPGGATDFAELSATFAIADGVAATDNVRLLNPFVRLEGRGLIDIGAQTIDMRIVPRAVNSAQGQGGDVGIAGIGVPFRISGPWARVSYRPAFEDVVQTQLRDILGQQQQGSALGALGEALFGRTSATPAESAEPETGTPAEGEATAQPAQQPQQRPEDRARDALGGLLRNALGGNREKQEPPPEPAPEPAPTP